MEMSLRNKISLLLTILFCLSTPIMSNNNDIRAIIITYEDYSTSSYAPSVLTIKYNIEGSSFLLENQEGICGENKVTSTIPKPIVTKFIESLDMLSKHNNDIVFTPQDIKDCISFLNDTCYADMELILITNDLDKDDVLEMLPSLRTLNKETLQIARDRLNSLNHKQVFSITLELSDKTTKKIVPSSIYQGDNWIMNNNTYINDSVVYSFLQEAQLNNLFFQQERPYFLVSILGILKQTGEFSK